MEGYKVPKQQAPVIVSVAPQDPEEGLVFLSPFAADHDGPETVHDMVSRPEPFIPVVFSGRGLQLVRKLAVRWVKVVEPETAEWRYLELGAGAPQSHVRFEYGDGEALEGSVRALTPQGEQRVLDVVNLSGRFLHVEAEDGLYLVNLAQVSAITVVDETTS